MAGDWEFEELGTIAARATFIYERTILDLRKFPPQLNQEESGIASERLERWRRHIAQGDIDLFETRLYQDNFTPQRARSLTATGHLPSPERLPDWAYSIRRALGTFRRLHFDTLEQQESMHKFLQGEEALGFQHLMVPFVLDASGAVDPLGPNNGKLIAEPAWVELQKSLLRRLCATARDTLAVEFSIWNVVSTNVSLPELESRGEGPGRTQYEAFVRHMWKGGLQQLFSKYPVLARLLGEITDLWICATNEFLSRLVADLTDFQIFGLNKIPPTQVIAIRTGLSDHHNGGRTVLAVEFETGLKLIYKNKSPATQHSLDTLLQWANSHGAPLTLRTGNLLSRQDYYWVEEVASTTCYCHEEVRRYYRRSGMLVCLMYMIGGYDFHAENIVACGEHPVIIDSETILHPELGSPEAGSPHDIEDSVLRTCMLPRRKLAQAQKDYNCGLPHRSTKTHVRNVVDWQDMNTDNLKLVKVQKQSPVYPNEVRWQGRLMPADDFLDDIVQGFRDIYILLRQHREQLLSEDGPLPPMEHLQPRFVFRDTGTYERVLRDMLQPQNLRDGMDASIRVDVLSRPLLQPPSNLRFWPLLVSEHAALSAGDIPMFFQSAQTGAVIGGAGREVHTPDCERRSGFQLLRQRFSRMSDADCTRHIEEIYHSFRD